jgi:hypothetical protein
VASALLRILPVALFLDIIVVYFAWQVIRLF